MSPCCPPPDQSSASVEAEPADTNAACCPPAEDSGPEKIVPSDDRPGYKLWPFVCGWLETPVGRVPQVSTQLTRTDILGRWQMRWGLGRLRYSIAPGLYALGSPSAESPVLVTANYKMSFDLLRRDMHGHHAWLLVLDTRGINVWCAAGKGTFGTREIIDRLRSAELDRVVNHRTLILPQLGAPGTRAHEITKATGFKIVFGPVYSADLPRFLKNACQATPEMRQVRFSMIDRLVLTPVELVNLRKSLLWSIIALFLLGGIGPQIYSLSAAWHRGGAAVLAFTAGAITGAVLVPTLLPWLPGRAFAAKGAIAGLVTGVGSVVLFHTTLDWLNSLALLMTVSAISSWCAMHFTGSSTFTSPSGVEQEMRQAIPAQAAALLVGALCWLAAAFQ